MSSVEDATTVVESMLEDGTFDRSALVEAILPLMDDDVDTMRRKLAKKRLSLIVTTLRDEHGERLAFPGRNEDGKPIVIHMTYTENARVMRDLAQKKRIHARAELKDADRLEERAYQLELFEQNAA